MWRYLRGESATPTRCSTAASEQALRRDLRGQGGMLGALPLPAWAAVVVVLSATDVDDGEERRSALLALRLVGTALAALISELGRGALGSLDVKDGQRRMSLLTSETCGLGRGLTVEARLGEIVGEAAQLQAVAALSESVRRGHMVSFGASFVPSLRGVIRAAEAMLVAASREGQLVGASLGGGASHGWSTAVMAQLRVLSLLESEQVTVADVVRGEGALERIELWCVGWQDVSILSGLLEVSLYRCPGVEDLGPLADVRKLVVARCQSIKVLPAMRNLMLEVRNCESLVDIAGLAGGSVGCVMFDNLARIDSLAPIAEMRPLPRTVVLRMMRAVADVAPLRRVPRVEVRGCSLLDKADVSRVVEGTLIWELG